MELVKENIEYEQMLGENSTDNVMREEFVVPDTHPDVGEILMLDTKAKVLNKELMNDKAYIEGQIDCTVLYMSNDGEDSEVCCVKYSSPFSNSIDIPGANYEMLCEAECYIEHMDCNIVNERKVCIEGIFQLKCEVYKKYDFQVVKCVEGDTDIQFAKKPTEIDKIAGSIESDMIGECNINIPSELPEIGEIIEFNVLVKSKELKIFDDMVKFCVRTGVKILYKARDSKELYCVEDDMYIEKECDMMGVNPLMDHFAEIKVANVEYVVKDNDEGESKLIDVEVLFKAFCKVMHKMQIDVIEDAYSPSMMLNMEKKNYEMNVMHKQLQEEVAVKGEIEIDDESPKPREILYCHGDACITEKKIVEDKVIVEGILNVCVVYSTHDKGNKYICTAYEEIPFNCGLETLGAKIHMQCMAKVDLEELECDIKGRDIKVKGLVNVYCRVNYSVNREFLIDLAKGEGEIPMKKASITIYVVQNGDTLWKIAKKYNTTVESLLKINELDGDDIKIDSKIIIPGRAII